MVIMITQDVHKMVCPHINQGKKCNRTPQVQNMHPRIYNTHTDPNSFRTHIAYAEVRWYACVRRNPTSVKYELIIMYSILSAFRLFLWKSYGLTILFWDLLTFKSYVYTKIWISFRNMSYIFIIRSPDLILSSKRNLVDSGVAKLKLWTFSDKVISCFRLCFFMTLVLGKITWILYK